MFSHFLFISAPQKQGFCVTLLVLKLNLKVRLALNSQACFCIPGAEIKGIHHHCLDSLNFFKQVFPNNQNPDLTGADILV